MNATHPSVADRRRTFRELHAAGCFVIPNPWDPGTARYLASLGFKALATTSSGFAWTRARPDNGITREAALAHLADMVAATDLPVNADFEGGFAADAAGVAESVRLAVETGVAGLSIEDSTGDPAKPLHELRHRRRADARGAPRDRRTRVATRCSSGGPSVSSSAGPILPRRLRGSRPIRTRAPIASTRRAFARVSEITAVVAAVAPKPVNLLIGSASELTMREIAALGVRRVSVGGALARSAWGGFIRAAKLIADEGRFDGFTDAASGADLNSTVRWRPVTESASDLDSQD